MLYTREGFADVVSAEVGTPQPLPGPLKVRTGRLLNQERWKRSMRTHFGGVRRAERRAAYLPGPIPCAICGAVALVYYFRKHEGRCRDHRHIAPPGLEDRAARWFARTFFAVKCPQKWTLPLSPFVDTPEDTRAA